MGVQVNVKVSTKIVEKKTPTHYKVDKSENCIKLVNDDKKNSFKIFYC